MLLDQERAAALPPMDNANNNTIDDDNTGTNKQEDTTSTTAKREARDKSTSSSPSTSSYADEEEETYNSLSLSSSKASTPINSPLTPVFQSLPSTKSTMTKSTGSGSSNLLDLNSTDLASAEEEDSTRKPLLPNLSLTSSSGPTTTTDSNHKGGPTQQDKKQHNARPSFLQDQFASFDNDEEEDNPFFLEDGESDHSRTNTNAMDMEHTDSDDQHQQEEEQHPLLRQRHNATGNNGKQHSKLLSNLHLPEKAPLPPQREHEQQHQSHHQKTKSMLEEELDYYPQPDDFPSVSSPTRTASAPPPSTTTTTPNSSLEFTPYYTVTKYLQRLSQKVMRSPHQYDGTAHNNAQWIGFWAMFLVTCSNYVLMPMRDAIALAVGVQHIPKLTLASTVLAFCSSVPIGWLFEAPDPARRRLWKKLGLTRGETQGTSLALFYRCFAFALWSYAIGFLGIECLKSLVGSDDDDDDDSDKADDRWIVATTKIVLQHVGQVMYIAFFLVVHLMKLHSLSLVWGVTTEAMEYEETARKRLSIKREREQQQQQQQRERQQQHNMHAEDTTTSPTVNPPDKPTATKMRLQRLAFVGFGGTVGGILGSIIASSLARIMRMSGLLVVSALMLEAAAQLAIELGRIMHQHWTEEQLFPSTDDLASLDPSMKRSASLSSMKRISSGNSLSRVKSMSELKSQQQQLSDSRCSSMSSSMQSLEQLEQRQKELEAKIQKEQETPPEDSFKQRLLRGIRTILQSRLLMAIFTYNALYASTTTLLSFQRAELVANRKEDISKEANTAFLANVNMASSVAVFALQASGLGAFIAHKCGSRGTLALMPMVRLLGVSFLAYWHQTSNGEPPNLVLFLMLDEFCRVMNMAVAKPVRESLWRGLSNEARYEAKPIVDTLANRWGGGSAAFLVSSIHRLLDLFGFPQAKNGEIRVVFGFPPVLFLCMIVAAWWAAVSADLGHIRKRIDLELKKMQ